MYMDKLMSIFLHLLRHIYEIVFYVCSVITFRNVLKGRKKNGLKVSSEATLKCDFKSFFTPTPSEDLEASSL